MHSLGYNLNVVDYEGRNPLHITGIFGQKEVAEFLVNKGIDVNSLDHAKNSSLYYAIKHKNYETALTLYNLGGKVIAKKRRLSNLIMK